MDETQSCFICKRDQREIPVTMWQFQERQLGVCCECMPKMIHKWPQVVARYLNLPDDPSPSPSGE